MASSLVQSMLLREDGGCPVADREPLAIRIDPICVRHTHAGRGAVPGEHDVAVAIDLREIGKLAIRRDESADIFELELLLDVGDPIPAERIPGQNINAARPQQRPQRHFHGAGIRRRHQRDAIAGGQLQQVTRLCQRQFQSGLGFGLAMITPEQRALQRLDRPAWTLGARPRRESWIGGAPGWFCYTGHARSFWPPSYRERLTVALRERSRGHKKTARRSDGRSSWSVGVVERY